MTELLSLISRARLTGLVVLGLLAMTALGTWGAAVAWRGAIADVTQTTRAERDAYWRAEIAAANARAEQVRANQLAAAAQAQQAADAEITRLSQTLNDLENQNAALPDADRCGLDRDRVRLLRQ